MQRSAVLHVEVNHNYKTGSVYGTKVTITQKSFQNIQPTSYADVYIGTDYITPQITASPPATIKSPAPPSLDELAGENVTTAPTIVTATSTNATEHNKK